MDGHTAATADADQQNAFRIQEKKYQLFKEQQIRSRNGKRRGGKLIVRATDLSEVVNLHEHNLGNVLEAQRTEVDGLSAYTFPRHPGFVLLPGFLTEEQQLHLICHALEDYPEPPARTNHTLGLGYLSGLWKASQLGLRLAFAKHMDVPQLPGEPGCRGGGTGATQYTDDGHSQHDGFCNSTSSANGMESIHCHQQSQPTNNGQLASADVDEHCPCTQGTASVDEPTGMHDTLNIDSACDPWDSATACLPENGSAYGRAVEVAERAAAHQPACSNGHLDAADPLICRSFDECWSHLGPGPAAAQLLRKMRWATLGPQYNWSSRVYEAGVQHRPLPSVLFQLAVRATDLAQGLPGCAVMQERPYVPDAALVNYYYEGDTLGGHRDDSEHDLGQPIVSLSLGCDAVFLIGQETRDVAPTALLLRSGDAVILSSHARLSYHGVPRIFTDRPLPEGLRPEQVAERYQAHMQHMATCRINISIRAVA